MDADWTTRFEVIRSKAPEQAALLSVCGDPAEFGEGHQFYGVVVGVWKLLSAKTKAPATRRVLTPEEIEKEKTNAKIDAMRAWVETGATPVKSAPLRKLVLSKISEVYGEAEYSIHSYAGETEFIDTLVSTIISKGTKDLMETLEKAGSKCSGRTKTLKDGREVSDSDFYRRSSDECEGKASYTTKMGKEEEVEYLRGAETTKGRFYLGDFMGSKWVSVEVLKSSKDGSGTKQVKVKDMSIEDPRPAEGKCKCACSIKKFSNLCEQSVDSNDRFVWEASRGDAPDGLMKACGAPAKDGGMCSRHARMSKQGKEVVEWTEEHLCGLTLTPADQ